MFGRAFSAEQIFKDVDNVEPGEDFVERIAAAVGSCDVLLPLIDEQWLTILMEAFNVASIIQRITSGMRLRRDKAEDSSDPDLVGNARMR